MEELVLLYPVLEEAGGELINTDRITSMIIGYGPKSALFVSKNLEGDVKLAVLLGTAGGLVEGLSMGEIVVCDKFFSIDGQVLSANFAPCSLACKALEKAGVKFSIGASVTVPIFGQGTSAADAMIVDMEDFYIAEVLHRKRIPLVVVRIISDLSHEKISSAQLKKRISALGINLREKFLIPFLDTLNLTVD